LENSKSSIAVANALEFKTPEEARAFLKRCGLFKNTRVIKGAEREKTLTMLKLMPSESSNSQHLWTETWRVGDITYDLVSGTGIDELIETTEHDI
jgi:hypothetical protein